MYDLMMTDFDLTTVEEAADLRTQIEVALEEDDDRVMLDFEHVTTIAEHFIEVAFGGLARDHGQRWFWHNVGMSNTEALCSDTRGLIVRIGEFDA